jgi:N-acyl-L-homoserine lactone synthetase
MLGDFNQQFAIISAGNSRLRQVAFNLRYQVFCVEKELFKNAHCVEEECDEYDDCSLHSLLQYKPTEKYVATVRLICPKKDFKHAQLPIEKIAGKAFYPQMAIYERLPRAHIAEISRFAVLPEFRPKLAALGLLRAIIEQCIEHDIQYLYAAIEPALLRIFQRLGIVLLEISPVVSYHGARQCFLGYLPEMLEKVYYSHPGIWEVLTDNGRLCPKPVEKSAAKKSIINDWYNFQ